ncbi:hypothetical protein BA768_09155 [Chryseobacterium sp. CBo1]|uniref:carboxypeptidase-like regulatory domain-containing protein n=1 Tax=Chryseobacterium sp. CBo1 TaxID=1869230 RepID=UPI0008108505|nr:carboxypeptidase-like regulatory domain-containing protein [Chryseobacterium sp. CBo1]OCK49522.1 hypothetical protein BA768_09155 [Chryseobacterium sp. CBo1]
MKHFYFLFVLLSVCLNAQKLQVIDSETGKPVSNARIVLQEQLVYTNEDGFAPVDATSKDFEVSALGFKKEKIKNFSSVIKLQPVFKEIEEVKIVSIDIKKLFQDVFKNYEKRYYDKTSVYDVVMKNKYSNNDKLYFMAISEAKLWSKTNWYNFKDGYNKRYDDIIQLQLNNVKYLKRNATDSVFSAKMKEVNHDYIGSYFFNHEVDRVLRFMKTSNAKFSGTIVGEEEDDQLINFKLKTSYGVTLDGNLRYNKIDKVITSYQIIYNQEDLAAEKKIAADGKEYTVKGGIATYTYEFYKKDGVYIPAVSRVESDKFTYFYKDETHVKKTMREIVYNTFTKADEKGLDPKVDFTKSIWQGIPVKDEKETAILLSKEEQEFVNEK